ncbi:MAG: metal ABC transporter substrate-binding protein [Candidatus Caldatribacteriaceae bacterium]
MKKINLFLLITTLILLLSFPLHSQEIPFKVAASIAPLCDLVSQVGGERVQVVQLIPNGFNPHAYEPTPQEVREMAEAKAVFLIGLGIDSIFARLLQNIDAQKPLFEVNENLEILILEEGHHHHGEEEYEEEGEDYSEGEKGYPDPHIWVSVRNAQIMVDNIARYLGEIDPEGREIYLQRAQNYKKRLQALDEWFAKEMEQIPNRFFVTSHNAWSYLARDYNLKLKGVIEKAPERETTPQELQELILLMKRENIRVIFVEPQFNQKIAQLLAQETESVLLELDALGSFPEIPYLELMEKNFSQILKGFTSHGQK